MNAATYWASQKASLRPLALALCSYAAFSTADAIIKQVSSTHSTFQIAFLLACFAFFPIALLTIGRGGFQAIIPKNKTMVFARAILGTMCCLLVWSSFAHLPLPEAYAILFTSPFMVTFLSAVILREQVGWRRWSATVAGFAGVIVMLNPDFNSITIYHGMVLAGAACGALSFIILRKLRNGELSASIISSFYIAIMLVTGPMAFAQWLDVSFQQIVLIAIAGLLMGAGQTGLVLATREAPAALVSPFQYTQMLWAVFYGILLFGNHPTTNLIIGMMIVIASGLFTVWREMVRKQPVSIPSPRGDVPARAAHLDSENG